MAIIKPFQGIRPAQELAASIAALPYDVYNRKEAKQVTEQNPLSFLKIDRAETQFPDDMDMYAQDVYDKAREILEMMMAEGAFIMDEKPCYYLYALTMNAKTQNGIVGCASIDDYQNGIIRRHENTRADKELDRIRHVDTLSAQTGPIFLAYRPQNELNTIIADCKRTAALYDFTGEDQIRHQVWKIADTETIDKISYIFSEIGHIYIADGHHRAASAVKVGLKRREQHPGYTGKEEFNYFLSVLFPENELHIFDYNRVVTGFNGYTLDTLLSKLEEKFEIVKVTKPDSLDDCLHPQKKGEISMYAEGIWFKLKIKNFLYTNNPVKDLDVSILQDQVLEPLLGIHDPKTDSRIQFIGGIRGLKELVKLTDAVPDRIAFAMYPTSMQELLTVADAQMLMPPKSTWFEPKLRSGLFIHQFER